MAARRPPKKALSIKPAKKAAPARRPDPAKPDPIPLLHPQTRPAQKSKKKAPKEPSKPVPAPTIPDAAPEPSLTPRKGRKTPSTGKPAVGTGPRTSPTLPASLVKAVPSSARAAKALSDFEDALGDVAGELRAASKNGATHMARAFAVLHSLKARFDDRDKMLNEIFGLYKNTVVPELFDEEGVTNIPLAEGFRIGVSVTTYASVLGGRKEEAFAWLRENGLGDLITETVNSSTLSGVAREWRDENRELPDSLFKTNDVGNTSCTRTK